MTDSQRYTLIGMLAHWKEVRQYGRQDHAKELEKAIEEYIAGLAG